MTDRNDTWDTGTCAMDINTTYEEALHSDRGFMYTMTVCERVCKDGCTGSSVLGCSDTLILLMYVQNISLVRGRL